MITGEVGQIKCIKMLKNYGVGRLIELQKPSPERVNPKCHIYQGCGGCHLMHLSSKGQQEFKTKRVKDCMERIGHLEVDVQPCLMQENPWYYHNKVQMPLGYDKNGQLVTGFYKQKTNDIIACNECLIQNEESNAVIQRVKELFVEYNIKPYDKVTHRGNIKHILTKKGYHSEEFMLCFITYQKTIAQADRSYQAQEYRQAITTYRQALALKSEEAYPRNMIGKAEQALAALEKQQADEAEKQRQEEERINTLKLKYTGIIAEADQAFKNENYSAAKLRYSEADQLNLGEDYPRKRLGEIEQIIHSSKYKARLAEYNKNKTLAEKNLEQKNYASAKVYFQKALTLSPADKESIRERIAETDRLIEAEQLAALDKAYQANTDKADKAYAEKAYAIAKFYYQKALEIKIGDKHATERLQEIEKYIGERQTKEAEL